MYLRFDRELREIRRGLRQIGKEIAARNGENYRE